MADLNFSFQEILDEIQAISRIGAPFLTAETQEFTLPNLVTVLRTSELLVPVRLQLGLLDPDGRFGRSTAMENMNQVPDVALMSCLESSRSSGRSFVHKNRDPEVDLKASSYCLAYRQPEFGLLNVAIKDNANWQCGVLKSVTARRQDATFTLRLKEIG